MTRLAYLAHLYTASGVVCGLLAILAATRHDFRQSLLWLVVATIVDATDGAFARWVRVDRYARLIDGARLDDIVDYVTYVIAPALVLLEAGCLPAGPVGIAIAATILLASAFGFSRRDAKTADYLFTGFPSYWNVVALYALVLETTPAVNATVLVILCVLVFVPIRYVYPSRTPTLRPVTVVFSAIWSLQVALMVWWLGSVPAWLLWSSLGFPIYYLTLSFWLNARRGATIQVPGAPAD
jgi:phosphatidylcholine synthase